MATEDFSRRTPALADESPTDGMQEFTPERWETAIEDAAELVAMLLDRGQSLFDAANEFRKTRPMLASAAGAAIGGAALGMYVAGRRMRASRPMSAVAQATAVAQAAAERLAQQQQAMPRKISAVRNGLSGH